MTEPATPTPEPTRLIVEPWASLRELPDTRPHAHDPIYETLLWQASELLYLLTGRQWPGEATSTRRLATAQGGRVWTSEARLAAAAWPTAVPQIAGGHGQRALQLPDPPVVEVLDVTVDGEPVEVDAQLPAGLLRRRDRQPWPGDGVEVTYRHGLRPPAGGRVCAILLTVELGKAWAGDSSCRLPKRIQTVTREGVTVGFVDKFEGLTQGRTGIYDIDLWVATVNPARLQRRSRVWTPDTAARRA